MIDKEILAEFDKLDECVDAFSREMRRRLKEKYLETEWINWDKSDGWEKNIIARIKGNLETGEMIDVANLAMFLWNLEFRQRKIPAKRMARLMGYDNDNREV